MGANSLWNHIWKKDLFPIVLSLYIVLLSEKFVVLIFNFWKFGFRFFVKICPNCVLFLIFFARCIIQFRWNQPTQRTETVPFFYWFIYNFFQFYIKLGIFYCILLWLWCTCQQFFLFLAQSQWRFLLYFFCNNVFANLQARLAGYCLARQSCPIVKLFVDINVCC